MKKNSPIIPSLLMENALGEDLCFELRQYIESGKIMPMLRHPLVYAVPYLPALNGFYNKQLGEKKKMLELAIIEKNYTQYVFLHERPHRISAFQKLIILQNLDDQTYYDLLSSIWSDSENIWQNKMEWKKLLNARKENKMLFMDEEERKFFNQLPDEIMVYRGYSPKNKNKSGYSFTLDKEKAEWFSKRFAQDGKVFSKTVKKSKVFAYMNQRNEQEIIII